ncbi:MAG: Ribonuclease 3 [Lentisphaerae bacterium ADurb.BinA184]|nr:MAG: Ribonuclease 3 [Lentisphaerae bacterium ADurb.BinA184]
MPSELEVKLGHTFASPGLLRQALTHPSYVAELKEAQSHNQRLEFLGDAVLQIAVTQILFLSHPDLREGDLSKIRAALTNESALVGYAEQLGLGEHVRLGRGEDQSGGRERPSVLADACEAVLGALYLDGGLAAAVELVTLLTAEALADPARLLGDENPKGALQELSQERHQVPPCYEVVSVSGPDHLPEFEVRVLLLGRLLATARGSSRRRAEQQAAAAALKVLRDEEAGHGL